MFLHCFLLIKTFKELCLTIFYLYVLGLYTTQGDVSPKVGSGFIFDVNQHHDFIFMNSLKYVVCINGSLCLKI